MGLFLEFLLTFLETPRATCSGFRKFTKLRAPEGCNVWVTGSWSLAVEFDKNIFTLVVVFNAYF
jgi:hypothetical protein